jgi:hypothetical protein
MRKRNNNFEEMLMQNIKKQLFADNLINKITRRDFYAGMAMCGMLSFGDTDDRSPKYISETSFKIADAMLEIK